MGDEIAWGSAEHVPPGLTVLIGEHGCGTTRLLRALHDPPRTVLLQQPPGDEWQDHDVATAAVQAEHLVGREYWTLSSGERQRVRVGTALAQEGLLLLDEPLGYLDDRAVGAVLDAIASRTAVVVCKSDSRALERADRVLELADGRLRPV